jgi:L-amino acid N-acyltransferase YncA
VLIRDADPAQDAAACAAIYAPYVRDTVVSLEERPPSAEEIRGRMERITRVYPWLIAERDGQVAGYAYGSEHRERAAYRWTSDVTVYVQPAFHRRGIGRELYLMLFDLLRAQGMYIACAGVTLPNEASVGLHKSLGFEPVGVYRGVSWKFGAWHDVGWWQLRLRDPNPEGPAELRPPARVGDLPA